MAWYPDTGPLEGYFPGDSTPLRAIGWLERDRPFETGEAPREVFERLAELLKDAWQPFISMGFHECELCRYTAEARGTRNLFVPGDGLLYVCPELITHYMNAHGYLPPEEFQQAVMACPAMNSMDYKKQLLANGGRGLVRLSRGG